MPGYQSIGACSARHYGTDSRGTPTDRIAAGERPHEQQGPGTGGRNRRINLPRKGPFPSVRGIIHGFHTDINLRALGRSIRALITVRLQPKTTVSVHAFHEHILRATETLAIDTITGSDDFIIEVAVPDVESLQTFVLEHITSRTDVVDARTSLVYEHHRRFVLEFLESSPIR